MSCDWNIPYDGNCCRTDIVPTDLEQKTADYYDCISDKVWDLVKKMYASELYGNTLDSRAYANMINDFHYLYGYLVIIYYQRLEDAANNLPCHTDQGIAFYLDEYEIECIKKYFLCKNVNIDSLLEAFDLGQIGDPDGINFMAIEECHPDIDPECPCEIFIVEKPLN